MKSRRRPGLHHVLLLGRVLPLVLFSIPIMLLYHPQVSVAATYPLESVAAQISVPRFEHSDCPVSVPDSVECGYLVVPEDRNNPAGQTLRLAVAVLKSHSEEPAPDPVVYLEGGPGGSALEGIEHWLTSPFRDDRELILFEQRGTRYSEPWLDCPELDSTYIQNWALGLSDEEEAAREVEAAIECRDRLQREGVNLAAYNSAAIAADLDDLRQALGHDEWNLYGISYGTRLALTAMRDLPDGIRSVILDSVYPPPVGGLVGLAPNAARVFNKLFEDCAADPACQTAYPNLESDLFQLIEQADSQPIQVSVRHPETDELLHLPLDGKDIVGELFLAFYDSDMIPFLPLVIDQARRGNHDVLVPLTDFTLQTYLSGSEGMNSSVMCAEEAPFNSPDAIAAAAEAVPQPLRAFSITSTLEICGLWGAGEPNPIETEPVYSDIPTLVLEGEYDPITPPSYGQVAAETLGNSLYYEFPGLGHGVTSSDCPASIAVAFLNHPGAEPDTSCMDEMYSPDFAAPDELYLTPAAYRILSEVLAEGSPLPFILLAFVDLFLLILVFVGLWALLRLLRLWPGAEPKGDWLYHVLLAAIATLNIIFLTGLTGFIIGTMFDRWSLLVFGLPKGASFLLGIPILAALLTFGLVIFLVVAWKRRYWSPARRLLYSLLTMALLAYTWFLSYWDLFGFRI